MVPVLNRRFIAKFAFFAGIVLMLLALIFLPSPRAETFSGNAALVGNLVSLVLFVSGFACAVFSLRINKRALFLFIASFLLLSGLFIFLDNVGIIPLPFSKTWPLLAVFAGLSLLPAGVRHRGGFSIRFFIPSCALVILGCFMMIFSLDMVPFSFSRFILTRWPFILAFSGLVLILTSLATHNGHKADREVPRRSSPN